MDNFQTSHWWTMDQVPQSHWSFLCWEGSHSAWCGWIRWILMSAMNIDDHTVPCSKMLLRSIVSAQVILTSDFRPHIWRPNVICRQNANVETKGKMVCFVMEIMFINSVVGNGNHEMDKARSRRCRYRCMLLLKMMAESWKAIRQQVLLMDIPEA